MKLYHPTKGLKGIRSVLHQFNEAALSGHQRELLKERLFILRWYDLNGKNQIKTVKQLKISRSHLQKLVYTRKKEGLSGLIPLQSGPKQPRGSQLLFSEKMEIERYASWFPDWGHQKLKIFFKQSSSTIYRYLKSKDMLVKNRCPAYHKKPTPRSAWKIKRIRLPEDYPVQKPGDLVVLDSIVEFIGPNFQKLYFVCCIDIATRIAFAMATNKHTSVVPRDLLQKMESILQIKIKAVLTDNGSEFLAYFQKACEDQGVMHFFNRPRTPKDNPVAERFNQTLQKGFYWRCDLTQPIHKINQELTKWLLEYNIQRPHETLDMRPPIAVYFNLFYKSRLISGVPSRLWNRTKPLLLSDFKI